jgi:hypothetical protein
MKTFWDRSTREEICARVAKLSPDARPQWGKFTSAQMLAHLNDAMRMATGELATAAKPTPLKRWPVKQLVVYLMPWPKGAPTAPELLARCSQADLATEQAQFKQIADQLATKSASERWPEHPAFGALTHKAWGVLKYRHADHHLRQFGL